MALLASRVRRRRPVSAAIELTQFVACLGMLELDDWPLNTMGTALGCLLYRKLFPRDVRECESN